MVWWLFLPLLVSDLATDNRFQRFLAPQLSSLALDCDVTVVCGMQDKSFDWKRAQVGDDAAACMSIRSKSWHSWRLNGIGADAAFGADFGGLEVVLYGDGIKCLSKS